MKMASFQFHRLCQILSFTLVFSFTFTITSTLYADDYKITALVNQFCSQTSKYNFCVEALYTDPRTPDADAYTLAYISFGLAYLNATNTQHLITNLLQNSSTSSNTQHDHVRQSLQTCDADYKKAIKALQSAFNDLDSETFFTLPGLASDTAKAAADCQSHYPPLTSKTSKLQDLCEICIVISKSFVAS